MKAIQFDKLGGPEVMQLREIPKPELRPGTVLIKNHAIGINFGDAFFLNGTYLVKPRLPDIPGMEAAGVGGARAADVQKLKARRRVGGIGVGAHAGFVGVCPNPARPLPPSPR